MEQPYAALFTPMQVGSVILKNRFVQCAMEGTNLIEGTMNFEFNKHCRDFYLDRARNGVALFVPGAITVRSFGGKWLGDAEKIMMGPVKELMDEIHSYDAKVFLQISAGMGRAMVAVPLLRSIYYSPGKRSLLKLFGINIQRVFEGPTAGMPNVWDTNIKTTEMKKKDIRNVVKQFGRAAALAKRAGIDGIEIHAIHEGYLLDQFAMNCTNKRTDEYGGSLENRFRFVCEIIQEIKRICGQDYPVSVRYSVESKMIGFNVGALPGEDYVEYGRGREESKLAAQLLENAGADLLDADNGTYDSWYWAHPPVYMPLSCNLDSAAFIKPYVHIPVVCAGRMEDPVTANEAIASGKIDGVGIARQLLCDPEYVSKVEHGEIADIRPCIACHNGCFAVCRYKGLPADICEEAPMGHCALNPATLAEEHYRIKPAEVKKKVAVIGGGIGGMESARLCALRGHDVTLYEKSGELGGVFIAAAAPAFKEKDKMLLDWYRHQLAKLPIKVLLHTEVKPDGLAALGADEIIIATGATPRELHAPGLERVNVMEAIEYLQEIKQTGERVVIIGGGLTGCEIAYDLVLKGKKPTIVEMQDDLLKIKGLCAANSNMLRDIIRHYEIPYHLNTALREINDAGVVIESPEGDQAIAADNVILSVGYVPGTPLAQADAPTLHIVGDAMRVANVRSVVWRAYDVALKI